MGILKLDFLGTILAIIIEVYKSQEGDVISPWVLFLNYKPPCTNPPEAVHTSIKVMRGLKWNYSSRLSKWLWIRQKLREKGK